MEVKNYFLVFGVAILLISLVSANFQTGNPSHSIELNYKVQEEINGWINMSFDNQSATILFTDSFGNSFSLEDLIVNNPEFNYTFNGTIIYSDFQILHLDSMGLEVPNIAGNLSYQLNFSNQEVFSEILTVLPKENITLKNKVRIALTENSNALDNLELKLSDFSSFIQEQLNTSLNLNFLSNSLKSLEEDYSSANSDADYQKILDALDDLNIPKAFAITRTVSDVKFYPDNGLVNLEIISQIAGGIYNEEQKDSYLGALFFWNEENLDTRITFYEISGITGLSEGFLLSYFEFNFEDGTTEGVYFILKEIDNLVFEEDYSQSIIDDYVYIDLSENPGKIAFTTTERVDFASVPVVISPSLDELTIPEVGDYIDSQKEVKISKWLLFVLVLALLLIVSYIIYTILQTWYDKRYEAYLFANRNNLYNLIIYINNAKKKGLDDSEIINNLKNSKWKYEQIRYVMRKYYGKHTGMPMLPFMKKKIEDSSQQSGKSLPNKLNRSLMKKKANNSHESEKY